MQRSMNLFFSGASLLRVPKIAKPVLVVTAALAALKSSTGKPVFDEGPFELGEERRPTTTPR